MIKLAYNKSNPNLVFKIDSKRLINVKNVGIVEYYIGVLKDDNTDTVVDSDYKVQVMAFESDWVDVPVNMANESINNQTKTVDPSTSKQNITPDSSYTGLDKVTVNAVTSSIDSNIAAGNIKDGVTILGVTGSVTELVGETAQVTPSTTAQTITPVTGNGLTSVEVSAVTSAIDANIVAGNIKKDVTILGVTGSLDTGGGVDGLLMQPGATYELTNCTMIFQEVVSEEYNNTIKMIYFNKRDTSINPALHAYFKDINGVTKNDLELYGSTASAHGTSNVEFSTMASISDYYYVTFTELN